MILVTGAKGYIGKEVTRRLTDAITTDIEDWDIRVPAKEVFSKEITTVVHLAALVRVGESVDRPIDYYDTNVNGTLNVIKAFPDAKMVFASTGAAFDPTSPYAHSKVIAEKLVKDCCKEYTIFRFYNVGGGNPTNPEGLPMAIKKAEETGKFTIFGEDYDTKDGTCVRDYIHVSDIADAIVNAVHSPAANTDYEPLGSGRSYTVKEYADTYQRVHGNKFDVVYGPRRQGDNPISEVPFVSEFIEPKMTLEDIV